MPRSLFEHKIFSSSYGTKARWICFNFSSQAARFSGKSYKLFKLHLLIYKTCKRNHAKTDQPKYFSLGTRILQPNYGRAKMCGGHVLCIYRSKYVCFVLLQWTCDWSWKWCLFSLERHEFKGKDTFKCKDMSGAVLRGTARVAYRQDSFIFIYFISGWRTTGWFIVPRQQWGRW